MDLGNEYLNMENGTTEACVFDLGIKDVYSDGTFLQITHLCFKKADSYATV